MIDAVADRLSERHARAWNRGDGASHLRDEIVLRLTVIERAEDNFHLGRIHPLDVFILLGPSGAAAGGKNLRKLEQLLFDEPAKTVAFFERNAGSRAGKQVDPVFEGDAAPANRSIISPRGGYLRLDESKNHLRGATRCPACAEAGAPVDRITLKALLTADALRRGVPAQPRYCATANCAVVYFDVDGKVTFAEADVIVPVYAKHVDDETVPVCYCFGVNVGSMRDAERAHELREMVAGEVQAAHCACEVKNPKGACCLGDLVRIERRNEESEASTSCCAST